MRLPGSSSQCRDKGMNTDIENNIKQKSVEESQVDLFYKCTDLSYYFISLSNFQRTGKVAAYLMILSLS